VSPPPRINERIEAIIGLSRIAERMAGKPGKFQADVAAVQVARGVVAFALTANPNLSKRGVDRVRPWKIEASRLIEAMTALKAGGKGGFIDDVVKECLAVLIPLEDGKESRANDLDSWLKDKDKVKDIPEKPLFKDDDSTVIKPSAEKTEG